ncbi:MAG: DUF4293 domain-containing protein [Tannerella sp.]|jgi:hypothetical protein|nr:DUF4293 domain-containing protein [Tannerella sp.]
MIQRIQTVYLLAVAALFTALLFLPLASMRWQVEDMESMLLLFKVDGLYDNAAMAYGTFVLFILTGIIILLTFTIIFMYKKRVLQMRMCVYNSLIIIGFVAVVGYHLWSFDKMSGAETEIKVTVSEIKLSIWSAFPIIALIFNYLAIRKIGTDEALVRSLERLR